MLRLLALFVLLAGCGKGMDDCQVIRKEKVFEKGRYNHGIKYIIFVKDYDEPFEISEKLYNDLKVGDSVRVYKEGDFLAGYKYCIQVVLEVDTGNEEKPSFRSQCLKDFLCKYGTKEEDHKRMLRHPEYRVKWEKYQEEWVKRLISNVK